MKSRLIQLYATKKQSFKNNITCKLFKLCWFMVFTFVLSISSNAQTNNCRQDDPLQWDWIQDLIAGSDGDNIAAIHQFEFEGNAHFNTVNADLENEPYSLFFNCEGEPLCEVVYNNYLLSPCEDLDLFLASIADFTIVWSFEDPFPAVTCPEGEPLQWNWIQDLMAEAEVCEGGIINQFYYNGNTYFQVVENSPICNFPSGYQAYYNCTGETVCYYNDSFGTTCDSNFRSASSTGNTIWTYNPTAADVCPAGNPLQWEWMVELIERSEVCNVGEIQQFEYNGLPYFQTVQDETRTKLCSIGKGIVYDCNGFAVCEYGGGNLFGGACDPEIINAGNTNNTIWANESGSNTCPEGDPLQWAWVQNLIQSASYCTIGELRQFEYEGDTYIYNTPREFDEGYPCKADYYPYKYYNCKGEYVCEVGLLPPGDSRRCDRDLSVSLNDYSTIWVYSGEPVSTNQLICPENNSTSICAPVSMPASLSPQDFSTTDDPTYMNSMTMQMDEQTDVQPYFTTTTRTYTISDESGNQKTCETKHHIANQFLQMPEVSQPGTVCEEDLWSYIKIGTDQYKIYADHNGSKGELMSTCNTPSLICSTADFGVDTKVPNQYNFWASTYFEFPDGTVCESEAMPFYVDVQAKPTATLNIQNKTMNIGEGMSLMDVVADNKSGYWSGENIIYLMTATGENIAYFSANESGVHKLYYTVRNENCERSYLLMVEVDADILGCTEASASNYNPLANVDDGSCSYTSPIDFDFPDYPWLNEIVNPVNCADEIKIIEFNSTSGDTLLFVKIANESIIYSKDGAVNCSNNSALVCLGEYDITSPINTWLCYEGVFQKFDFVYTICAGETLSLTPNYQNEYIPCECPPCAPVGPPLPPEAIWLPAEVCPYTFCFQLEVSPLVSTVYQALTETSTSGGTGCGNGLPPPAPGPPGTYCQPKQPRPNCLYLPLTPTNFLVIVEQCPPAKTATVELPQKIMEASFNMYPNPTTSKVFVDLSEQSIYQINLMDISGKIIKQTKLDATITEINVSDLPKGMYLVELENETHSKIQKLIIK